MYSNIINFTVHIEQKNIKNFQRVFLLDNYKI
jgi:hypothetical protein